MLCIMYGNSYFIMISVEYPIVWTFSMILIHDSSPLFLVRDTLQAPQYMPETVDSTEPTYIQCFFYTYITVVKFNL